MLVLFQEVSILLAATPGALVAICARTIVFDAINLHRDVGSADNDASCELICALRPLIVARSAEAAAVLAAASPMVNQLTICRAAGAEHHALPHHEVTVGRDRQPVSNLVHCIVVVVCNRVHCMSFRRKLSFRRKRRKLVVGPRNVTFIRELRKTGGVREEPRVRREHPRGSRCPQWGQWA